MTSKVARYGKVRNRLFRSSFSFQNSWASFSSLALFFFLSLSQPLQPPPPPPPQISGAFPPPPPPPTKQTFVFLSTTANSGSVVACPTDALNGTDSTNCTTAVSNLNAFAPGGANAVVGGVSVQGLLAYVVVGNTATKKQAVVACDVNYLTGALSGCQDSGAVFSGIAAVTPGLKGARVYAATQGPGAATYGVGGAYKCDLAGKAITNCVTTATPATKFNGAAQMALATRGFA